LSITGGVASFPIDGRTRSELIRKADQALYRAKQNRRNTIRLAYEERMVAKTAHFTQTQLERLSKLAEERKAGEAKLLREALDDLLSKYGLTDIER
jgi:predicted signal transduction protein with EAL and GGDEF domain